MDDVYMTAVQTMTGTGGWPLSLFLTPDAKALLRRDVLPAGGPLGPAGISDAARGRRPQPGSRAPGGARDVRRGDWSRTSQKNAQGLAGRRAPSGAEVLAVAARSLDGRVRSGARRLRRRAQVPAGHAARVRCCAGGARTDEPAARAMVETTLEKMAAGGMYDQVGGGFHRYSVDARWLVPHFEKMLYDNAMLARRVSPRRARLRARRLRADRRGRRSTTCSAR